MKKILTALLLPLLVAGAAYAQNDADALRYSQLSFGGTARSVGIAGAFGALGADFSSASNNPAGIGLYRGSEFTFTPSLVFVSSKSDFAGQTNSARKYNFNISNFGLAWVANFDETKVKKWKSLSFALGANRLANFNNKIYYKGFNNSNSLITGYVEDLNASGVEPGAIADNFAFDANLAYSTGLITQGNNGYESSLSAGGIEQSNIITTSGNITEYVLSMAANYDNKLYLGATIGIPGLHFKYSNSYKENDPSANDNIPDFNDFTLTNNVNTSGVGVNAKFGLIYRINDYFRIGAAIHSPTYFALHDEYSSALTAVSGSINTATSPAGSFDYNLTTPWRFVGSAAIIFKKYGFISADYEFVDYSQAFYTFDSNNASDVEFENRQNNIISAKYTGSSNLRIGGELVLDIFRFRAGYAMYGTPFSTGNGVNGYDNATNYITGGIGFRDEDFFLDLGFMHPVTHSFNQPYSLTGGGEVPGAKITTSANAFVATFGIKF